MTHFNVKDIEAVKQGAGAQDVHNAMGVKSMVLNTKARPRVKGGLYVSQERYVDAVKRDVADTVKNMWRGAVSTINPYAIAREKNDVKDVFFQDADGHITRGRQVSHWHIKARGQGSERKVYESYTLLANGDIIHTQHEQLSGGRLQTHVAEIIKDPSNSVQKGREVWVVDEASMVGSKQLHSLVSAAEKVGARLVLIGDTKQLQSISAGKMFAKMQESGAMRTVEMTEAIRQQDAGYREIVQDVAGKRIETAFGKLDKAGKLHEIGDTRAGGQLSSRTIPPATTTKAL
jgi:hypothetical protein